MWFTFVPWLPTYPGQLAPTTLALCRLVSNSRSEGLSPPPSLSFSLSGPPPTVTQSLSLSRIKGFSGCSLGLYLPRGLNPLPQDSRGVLYPLSYEEMLSALLF